MEGTKKKDKRKKEQEETELIGQTYTIFKLLRTASAVFNPFALKIMGEEE